MKKNLPLFICFVALLVATLVGCGTSPMTKDLRQSSPNKKFDLKEPVILDASDGSFNASANAKYGYFPGTYTAEKENDFGTFYRSPKFSVFSPSVHGKYVVRTGGIWIPKDPSDKPRMYGYLNQEWQEVKDFEAVMSSMPRQTQYTKINVVVTPGGPVNTAGGAVGGAIVNAIIASGTGDILIVATIQNKEFSGQLKALTDSEGGGK